MIDNFNDVARQAQYMAQATLTSIRNEKMQINNLMEKVEYLQSRMEGLNCLDYSKERIQSTPDPDPMANVVEDLIKEKNNLEYHIMMYNLRLLVLQSDCMMAGFSPEQVRALIIYYSDVDSSYEKVASELNINKEKARYYVKGKGYGKYNVQYKLASMYIDMMQYIEEE